MVFTALQIRSLTAKLKRRHVKVRENDGTRVAYVEGWHAIAEANRIFSFENWDRQTLAPTCHWTKQQNGETVCFYSTKVRITVRAGDTTTIREGIGTGFGRSPQPEVAHDIALKSAETDATKRALATFGNPFGLALYDRDQAQVTKARSAIMHRNKRRSSEPDLILIDKDGNELRLGGDDSFTSEALRQIDRLESLDDVYAFWSRNLQSLAHLRQRTGGDHSEIAQRISDTLKQRARDVSRSLVENTNGHVAQSYLIPKEKRIRDREHLAFVANEPCLICGRRPAQAHHLRFAQPRAMALKVSDEYTVPLCITHHDQLHRSGDERAFWVRHGFCNPLEHAERYWRASRRQRHLPEPSVVDPDVEQEFNEPAWRKEPKRKDSRQPDDS